MTCIRYGRHSSHCFIDPGQARDDAEWGAMLCPTASSASPSRLPQLLNCVATTSSYLPTPWSARRSARICTCRRTWPWRSSGRRRQIALDQGRDQARLERRKPFLATFVARLDRPSAPSGLDQRGTAAAACPASFDQIGAGRQHAEGVAAQLAAHRTPRIQHHGPDAALHRPSAPMPLPRTVDLALFHRLAALTPNDTPAD